MSDRRHLIIVVRADPIICGHSTEARNLAEAAVRSGFDKVDIVTYPERILATAGLPLKPADQVLPYGRNITVHRPEPVGDYKVIDGRVLQGMAGRVVDLLTRSHGQQVVLDLYLVPHGRIVIDAIDTARAVMRRRGSDLDILSIAEVVGSDITNVVRNAITNGAYGVAAQLLQTYLDHDLPVAVSRFTRDLIVHAGVEVDDHLQTTFASELRQRILVNYPAIDTKPYLSGGTEPHALAQVLRDRGLEYGQYMLFLSRLARAKGADDAIHAYRRSSWYGVRPLVIAGNGPALPGLQRLANNDPHIRFITDLGDREKPRLMHACGAFVLPSKPSPEFVETFGIVLAEKMLAGGPGPIITTRTGGIPEATGDHCVYVDAGDPVGIAAALDEVARWPRRRLESLANEAQEYAMRFDRQEILRNLVDGQAALLRQAG